MVLGICLEKGDTKKTNSLQVIALTFVLNKKELNTV